MDLEELVALARKDAAAPRGGAALAHVFNADDVDVDALIRRLVAPPLFGEGSLIDAAPLAALLASCARHCFCEDCEGEGKGQGVGGDVALQQRCENLEQRVYALAFGQ